MKILVGYFKDVEKLFDWYFHLAPIKRIQLNYIIILVSLVYLTYENDKQHRENLSTLSSRIDTINNARSREQKEYSENLKFYITKYTDLLEKSLRQKEQIEKIKDKQ
jgi:hypothetical protein